MYMYRYLRRIIINNIYLDIGDTMRNNIPEFIFISVENNNLTPELNKRRTEVLISILNDLKVSYTKTVGSYRFNLETSFMVRLDHGFTPDMFKDIAVNQFNQECILHRDKNKKGFLLYKDNTWEYTGIIDQISEKQAVDSGTYTYFPTTKQYMGYVNVK